MVASRTGGTRQIINNKEADKNKNNSEGHYDDQQGAGGDNIDGVVSTLDNDSIDDIDGEHLFHQECLAHRFGWLCVVCEKPLPIVTKLINTTTSSSDGEADTVITSNSNDIAYSADGCHDIITTDGSRDRNEPNDMLADSDMGDIIGDRTTDHLNFKWRRTTKVQFVKHPFFINERMCPHHVGPFAIDTAMPQQQRQPQRVGLDFYHNSSREGDEGGDIFSAVAESTSDGAFIGERRTIRRCAGCHRFEPSLASPAKHFVNVGDPNSGQCLCLACCRTVVTTSDDAIPLWDKVSFHVSI